MNAPALSITESHRVAFAAGVAAYAHFHKGIKVVGATNTSLKEIRAQIRSGGFDYEIKRAFDAAKQRKGYYQDIQDKPKPRASTSNSNVLSKPRIMRAMQMCAGNIKMAATMLEVHHGSLSRFAREHDFTEEFHAATALDR
jgi:ActR/RegA family two-component response regulator